MRAPLVIAALVLVVIGIAVATTSGMVRSEPPPLQPITVQAPRVPPGAPPAEPVEPAPRDEDGYVAPPPAVGDDDDDGPDDDGPDDDADGTDEPDDDD
ncbi:hypothetical protein [Pseudonocardia humida]|uniref:Small secreted hydrophilic protein n=1 Tax=Pseudonocardia humida TaxID=2800819 RepID=A0ABT1A4E0_9PSEU|nr:hypothetical protein [Pseudonocardia humida]MCO1657634.1 hypothetical protein [Pseudonocardia humida]